MKALRARRPGVVALDEIPMPEPGNGEVRIRTACCGICATDLDMIAGSARASYPVTLGHEWSGIVDACGPGVPPDIVGRHCVGDNMIPCGTCAACREGRDAACQNTREVGFELPGGYAEFFVTRARNLYFLTGNVPFSTATLTEPLAVVKRALGRLKSPTPFGRGPTLVMGDGPIGLASVLVLHQEGTRNIALVGGRENRLALGKAFGAEDTCSYKLPRAQILERLSSIALNGFALAIEASGNPDAFDLITSVIAKDGEFLILGDYGNASVQLPLTRVVQKELRLLGSNSGTGAWSQAVEFLERHFEMVARMITQEFPIAEFEAALATVQDKRGECIKVVLKWGE